MVSRMRSAVLPTVLGLFYFIAIPASAADYGKVMQVTGAAAATLPTPKPTLLVGATGLVSDGGWHQARLIPYVYVVPPADGIWDFDFIAERREGPAILVISPIHAFEVIPNAPDWVKGVRIHAVNNELEVPLANEFQVFQALASDSDAPLSITQNGKEITAASLKLGVKHEREGDKHCAVVEAEIKLGRIEKTIEVGRFCIEVDARCVRIDHEAGGVKFKGEACVEDGKLCVRLKACKDFGGIIGELCTPEKEKCVDIVD